MPGHFHHPRLFVIFCFGLSWAQSSYQPSLSNLKARQEFQDAKFGMFIYRSAYTVLGDGEWVFTTAN